MGKPALFADEQLDGLELLFRGKVRDVYRLDPGLLLVATDRVSAYDVVLPGGIPGKGEVLTRLTAFWLERMKDIVPHHLLGLDPREFPEPARRHAGKLAGRAMWVKRAEAIPVECVVRGRLAGSALREYNVDGRVGGEPLPPGLVSGQVLDPPIFTPATKAQEGHDENVGFDHVVREVGKERAERLRSLSIAIFQRAAAHAKERGLILVDTKFEFGIFENELMLIDEVLTSDSSRYWRAETVGGRGKPFALDKQHIRDWLDHSGWNKEAPGPALPPEVVAEAQRRYQEAYERLTGASLGWEIGS